MALSCMAEQAVIHLTNRLLKFATIAACTCDRGDLQAVKRLAHRLPALCSHAVHKLCRS